MKRILWTALILASASPAFAEPIWKFDQTFVGNPDDKLVAVEVSINLNDALGGPAALIVVFDGDIVQTDAIDVDQFPTQIDQSAGGAGVGAIRTDTSGLFDYDKALESWFYFGVGTGSAANTTAVAWRGPIDAIVDGVQWSGIAGGEVGSRSFRMAAGSGSGATGLVPGNVFIPVAHLVIDLKKGLPGQGGSGNPSRLLGYQWQTGHASVDGTTALQFPAGGGFQSDTFKLIPEPSSFVLAGLGAVALLGLVRRRRAA